MTKKISRGLRWKHVWYDHLFGSHENVEIVEVRPVRRLRLGIAYEKKELVHTSAYGTRAHALAAINGNFFDTKNGGSVDFLKVDNLVVSEDQLEAHGKRARHQLAAVTIQGRKVEIVTWDGTADWEHHLPQATVMCTGPLLLKAGREVPPDTAAFNRLRHPRSALAITNKGRILLVTVDGRDAESAGMSLPELSRFLKWIHAVDAINLDGGGSTALWIAGESANGIVNYPSDNKIWDHQGERKVANAILVLKKK